MPTLTTISVSHAAGALNQPAANQGVAKAAEVVPPTAVQQEASRQLADQGTKKAIADKNRIIQREKRSEAGFANQERPEENQQEGAALKKTPDGKLNRVA